MLYDNQNDATNYLAGSYVLYDKHPYLVRTTSTQRKKILLELLPSPGFNTNIVVPLEDPLLNYTQFNLGYANPDQRMINDRIEATYFTRMSVRRLAQGLSEHNVRPVRGNHRYIEFGNLVRSRTFDDMLNNVYPSFKETIALFEKEPHRQIIAFSRKFAMFKDPELEFYELHYKGMRIGWGAANDLILPTEYEWIKESLIEEGVSLRA